MPYYFWATFRSRYGCYFNGYIKASWVNAEHPPTIEIVIVITELIKYSVCAQPSKSVSYEIVQYRNIVQQAEIATSPQTLSSADLLERYMKIVI